MKQLIIFIFAGFFLVSCHKENAKNTTVSYEIMQHPTWAAEEFKTNYTIQFPPGYTGGIYKFEGHTFDKYKPGSPVKPVSVSYVFSPHGNWNYDFGDTLVNVSQPSIVTWVYGGDVLLDHRLELTANGQLIGVIYHNNNDPVKGAVYWKDDNVFKKAVMFGGFLQNLPEIIEILRTIKKI